MYRSVGVLRSTAGVAMCSIAALLVSACSGDDLTPAASVEATDPASDDVPTADPSGDGTADGIDEPSSEGAGESQVDGSGDGSDDGGSGGGGGVPIDVVLEVTSSAGSFDRHLLGTNIPAWLSQERFERTDFLDAIAASGVTMIRMPGGSWSNAYDWLACEMDDESGCFWTWAARPADFARLLTETDLPGMWTVSINETAEQAAALVAYFNGDPDDDRSIGVDRDGVDWQTVGTWASLRRDNGQLEPVGVEFWEVGNEVYAGKPGVADGNCASFGWEDVWTCDGADYVTGTDAHDGYLEIRDAMRAVDPTISVGAVGVVDPGGWDRWGAEVIAEAGDALDYYIIHHYGFDSSPQVDQIMASPTGFWPPTLGRLDEALGDVPIALTEHNLVAVPNADTDRTITHASNAIFLADTIGQLAQGGVEIANQWDFASGTQDSSGTNYGLLDADSLEPFPTFFAMALWSRFGDELIAVDDRAEADSLGVYAGRRADGVVTAIMVNRTADPLAVDVRLDVGDLVSASLDTLRADDPASSDVIFNGETGDAVSDLERPGSTIDAVDGSLRLTLPAWSVNLVVADVG